MEPAVGGIVLELNAAADRPPLEVLRPARFHSQRLDALDAMTRLIFSIAAP